jgi:hypothetical protein
MSACLRSEEPEARASKIACRACRSRKVKCNRDLPWCSNCRNCGQQCIYPSTMLKPGPKVGSVHKRRRMENHLTRRSAQSSPSAAPDPVTREELPSSPRSSPRTIGREDESLYSKHMQAVSDLCHMTNEDPPPATADIVSPTNTALQAQNVLTAACDALGISPDFVEQTLVNSLESFFLFKDTIPHGSMLICAG